jgi:hypothetical protein
MAVNQKQFAQLTEMDISLWQRNNVPSESNSLATNSEKKVANFIEQTETTLSDLFEKQIFIDILQSVDISIGEISHKNNHLDLGLFNWYFNSTVNDTPAIYYDKNNLFTPSIKLVSQSSVLKKQLWQTIQQKIL